MSPFTVRSPTLTDVDAQSENSDDRLVSLSRDGNIEAFNSLVERHQAAVYTLCLRLLGHSQSAEDAAQETFLAAYRGLSGFAGGSARSWLLRIAANESKDELRRRKRRVVADSLNEIFDAEDTPVEIAGKDPPPELLAERAEMTRVLEAALLRLPFDQRQAILMCDYYGFHYEEVAAMTSSSMGTVKSRIHRGRERLRSLLSPQRELFERPGRLEERER